MNHHHKFKPAFMLRAVFAAMVAVGGGATALHAEPQASHQSLATISGEVTDTEGEPLVGATVLVKGSKQGVATDLDGKFTVQCPAGTTLTVSYVGYNTQDVKAQPGMTVVLKEDSQLLSEVVVVGYGSVKRESLTGSVSTVSSKAFEEKGALSSPLEALQGQVPGVIITRSSGAPGDESWNINLRGSVSVNSTDPLIIIDGVASSTSDLNALNPSDIESINFLKDGSAAIYGSRAAGGVVIVVTKSGQEGKVKVDYAGLVSLKRTGLQPTLLSLDQWTDGLLEVLANDGASSSPWATYANLLKKYRGSYINLATSANPFGTGAFTDVADFVFDDEVNWLQSLFGDAWNTEHNLSVSGGGQANTYRIAFRYLYDGSTLQYGHNKNQRFNFRVNDNYKFSKKVNLESIIGYARQEQVAPTQIGSALNSTVPQPGLPLTTVNGKAYGWGTWGSPVGKLMYGGDNNLSVSSINISETLHYAPTDYLDFTGQFGYSTSSASRDKVQNPITFYDYMETAENLGVNGFTQTDSYYTETNSQNDYYSGSVYGNFHKTFKGGHYFSGMLGWQYEFNQYKYFGITIKDIQQGLEVVNGSGDISKAAGTKNQYSNQSWFTRLNYDYEGRYLLEFNGRYDGSSKFQPENRWKFFWGVSGGWRIAQEKFMEWSRTWLSNLKLRASYAQVGNQSGIGYYDGVQLYNINSSSGAYIGTDLLSTITVQSTLASNDRTWERIKNYNLALDMGFLNGGLEITVEGFMKRNDNMLVSVEYPSTLGIGAPSANRGKFKDYGAEVSGQWNQRFGEFTVHAGGSFTFARNKLVDYGGTSVLSSGYTSTQQGYPLYSIFGLVYGGKIQNEEMLQAYLDKYYEGNAIGMPKNLRVGDNMYCDLNGDGILDQNDMIYLGSDTPEISYSFNFGGSWRGIDVNVVFQGTGNRFVYRGIDNFTVPFRNYYCNFSTSYLEDSWSVDNPDGYYCPLSSDSSINSYNYQASSLTAMDARYIRLKNVTVGYTFPARLLRATNCISSLRVYFTGTDLWEWSRIKDGWDPEASRTVSGTGRFPFTRGYTFGLNVSF